MHSWKCIQVDGDASSMEYYEQSSFARSRHRRRVHNASRRGRGKHTRLPHDTERVPLREYVHSTRRITEITERTGVPKGLLW
ncbi:hypothetical protein D915_009609 [Fasciola hepatica]|uniref:Uncharacterized protein n=1 Tax=Fasciola hepatica TaxID=6192 RepID=A0A4E0QW93_FASHE|nr:hypothetical protein D915_009609 [Fasciola hepatica]